MSFAQIQLISVILAEIIFIIVLAGAGVVLHHHDHQHTCL